MNPQQFAIWKKYGILPGWLSDIDTSLGCYGVSFVGTDGEKETAWYLRNSPDGTLTGIVRFPVDCRQVIQTCC